MSEATELAAVEGQAEEAPQSTEPEFGFDDTEDTPVEAPEQQSGQTEDETPTATDTPEEDQGGYLRQQDYTKKTMDLAEERKAFEARVASWEETQRSQQEQIQQTLQALRQSQQPQAQSAGLVQQLQEVAANPNLTAEDRAGLNVIAGLANELEAAKQTIAELNQFREQVSPQFEQITQTVSGITTQQQQAQVTELRGQLDAANQTFGAETVEAVMPLVRRMAVTGNQWSPEVNPQTGKPFTIPEMVGLLSGKLAEEASTARQAQSNGARGAKKLVAGTGTTGATKAGEFSKADALAEIAALQG